MKNEIKLLAEKNFYQYNGIRLHLAIIRPNGQISVAKPPEFEDIEEGCYTPEFLNIPDSTAQALMDSLYDCGYRPTRPLETLGQVDAIKYHLEDMRRLVFKEKK